MGAIAGVIYWEGQRNTSEAIISDRLQQYHHDVFHSCRRSNAYVACAHQWMTEESVGEVLPHVYKERYIIAADAILDNRADLFSALSIHPSRRAQMTDTMLIVRAFEKWKENISYYLHGDYAFIIWDEHKQKLYSFRDFSGTRSLYYRSFPGGIAVSTTIQPLLDMPDATAELDERWIAEYLAIPTMIEAIDAQRTPFKQVHQVPPSHLLIAAKESTALKQYQRINPKYEIKFKTNQEYEEAFLHVLNVAVRDRMRTTGNVGSHLSGGLDSTTVTALAARETIMPVHTYSMLPLSSYQDWTNPRLVADESEFIQAFVEHTNNLEEHSYRFEKKNLYSDLSEHLQMMEMPFKFLTNFFWLTGFHEEAKKHGVKVMLNGSRGNNSISYGSVSITYDYYVKELKRIKWMNLNKELTAFCNNYQTGKRKILPMLSKKMLNSENIAHEIFPSFINKEFAKKMNVDFIPNERLFSSEISEEERRLIHFLAPYTWNKSGVADTKMSLKTGIWNRDPTNDARVVQFCLSIPEEQYSCGGLDRSLIRRSTKTLLPEKIRMNLKYRGYQAADTIQRLQSEWKKFLQELRYMEQNNMMQTWLDMDVFRKCMKEAERADASFMDTYNFHILIRALSLYRFVHLYQRREVRI